MSDQTPKFPESLPNTANLRLRARKLVGTERDTPLTHKEALALAWIIGRELGPKGFQSQLLAQAQEEFKVQQAPRFTTLYAWMQPYALFPRYPNAVLAVARYLLGDTTKGENARIDWVTAASLFGDDFTQEPQENARDR